MGVAWPDVYIELLYEACHIRKRGYCVSLDCWYFAYQQSAAGTENFFYYKSRSFKTLDNYKTLRKVPAEATDLIQVLLIPAKCDKSYAHIVIVSAIPSNLILL